MCPQLRNSSSYFYSRKMSSQVRAAARPRPESSEARLRSAPSLKRPIDLRSPRGTSSEAVAPCVERRGPQICLLVLCRLLGSFRPPDNGVTPQPTPVADLWLPCPQAIYVSLSLISLVGLVGAGVAVGSGVGCAAASPPPLDAHGLYYGLMHRPAGPETPCTSSWLISASDVHLPTA